MCLIFNSAREPGKIIEKLLPNSSPKKKLLAGLKLALNKVKNFRNLI